jgi:amidohydrolase
MFFKNIKKKRWLQKVYPIDSAIVAAGSFAAKNSFNVIADSVELIGWLGTFKADVIMEGEG